VGPTDDEAISRITLTVDGALHPIDQVTKQLHKLVNVLKIRDLEPGDSLARELALFKVTVDGAQRAEVMQICDVFRGKVVDVSKQSVIFEVTGTTEKIRTGEIAIARGRDAT
jgi:acetolactate synthase I/III small subunit